MKILKEKNNKEIIDFFSKLHKAESGKHVGYILYASLK